MTDLIVIGGGLAGAEAAYQAAKRGIKVTLYEMRPKVKTEAHVSSALAELVCSNSLGSKFPDRASGLLKHELRRMDSLLIKCADHTAVPAGGALAVDRVRFSQMVTTIIESHPSIRVIRDEYSEIPQQTSIIASGPLTSKKLTEAIQVLTGEDYLYFFDAISPIITFESINMDIAFKGSRYNRGELEQGDYINCPLTQDEYDVFIDELINAKRIQLKSYEKAIETGIKAGAHQYFEGCLPVEIIAKRGHNALAFGPMRPVGLEDPKTRHRPHAVVQLRQDNLVGSLYNMVGFQTNLTYSEQKRVFRLIPGLEMANFSRFGQMHRNTFILAPRLLRPTLQLKHRDALFFAGQITGVEGYAGNIASGLIAGWNAARFIKGDKPLTFPISTMTGALCHYITHANLEDFQPMKANFGILPPLENKMVRTNKRTRAKLRSQRALEAIEQFLERNF